MKAQYSILADLRKIDEKIFRLQDQIEKIPDETGKLNQALQTKRDEYDKAKQLFDASEKKLRKSEQDLKEREDKLHKAEDKMMEVKTNEEYQAAIRENQNQKSDKSGVEDQALTLMSEVDQQRQLLKEVEKTFKAYEEGIKKDLAKIDNDRAGIAKTLEEQLSHRHAAAGQLNPEVSSIYLRVAARTKGVGIVYAENGMCLGCHMKVRPQLYNEILGFKAVHRCPTCGRILIIPPKEPDVSDAEASAK